MSCYTTFFKSQICGTLHLVKQEARGLLSSVEIKTPLSKILLLCDLIFWLEKKSKKGIKINFID